MKQDLRIAVVIPVYNAMRYVRDAVRSALEHPEVVEVVLVEDGSTDGSLAVCEELAAMHERVKLFRHPGGVNRGAGASRNLSINKSTAPYVAFLDADDRYLPDRFLREKDVFAQHPDAEGVYSAIGTMYLVESARERYLDQVGNELTTVREQAAPEELFSRLLKGGPFGYFSLDGLTVTRSALDRLSYLFAEPLRLHQDSEFILRLAHTARLYPGELTKPVTLRGVHDTNRILADRDPAPHRQLLYSWLRRWSTTVSLRKEDARLITARWMNWSTTVQRSKWSLVLHARHFIRHPWLMRSAVIREVYIDRLFGKGSRMARALRSLTWRLLRNGGPTI